MRPRRTPSWALRRFPRLAAGTGLVAVLVSVHLCPAWGNEGLTDSERQQLDRGGLIVKTRQVDGYPWPQVTVYRRVAASPEEVMAVYADFDSQRGYLPRLVESRVVERVSRNSFHVSYEYEVTGPNERYTVLAAVSRSPGGFQATWNLVSARYARQLSGRMKVERVSSGALIEYTNRVDPGFLGVRLGAPETTARQVQETAQALGSYVERLRVEEPETLKELIRALNVLLGES